MGRSRRSEWVGPQEVDGWDPTTPQKKKSGFTSCPPVDDLEVKMPSFFFCGVFAANVSSGLVISAARQLLAAPPAGVCLISTSFQPAA